MVSLFKARILAVASLAALIGLPAGQATASITLPHENGANPRGWSAVAGMDTAEVIQLARSTPAGAGEDVPYCDRNQAVAQTLAHDFGETLISDGAQDTQLWASSVMGTWTVLLKRPDATSCVIASGIGYSDRANPGVYFTQAGLNG